MFAQAYDNPIPGYNTETVGNLRLFEALAEHEFQLEYFNEGDFAKVPSRVHAMLYAPHGSRDVGVVGGGPGQKLRLWEWVDSSHVF